LFLSQTYQLGSKNQGLYLSVKPVKDGSLVESFGAVCAIAMLASTKTSWSKNFLMMKNLKKYLHSIVFLFCFNKLELKVILFSYGFF